MKKLEDRVTEKYSVSLTTYSSSRLMQHRGEVPRIEGSGCRGFVCGVGAGDWEDEVMAVDEWESVKLWGARHNTEGWGSKGTLSDYGKNFFAPSSGNSSGIF